MFYVTCPCCESPVEIPVSATFPDPNRLPHVVVCGLCDTAFDADDTDATEADEPAFG